MNWIKSLFKTNYFVKPLSVITASTPPLIYLGVTNDIFMGEEIVIEGQDLVAISAELAASFQGALILMVLLISIIYIYKPPKLITWMLILGGMALFASAMLETIGMVLITYGVGLGFNALTVDRFIRRNDLFSKKHLDKEVDKLLGG